MLELAFSEQSLEVQRGVVMEEFKQRCLNQPYGDVGHLIRPLAYEVHPYRWPTIGKDLSHIEQATLEEVKSFFYRFYAPNNAVLAVTGNISWEEAVRLTEKWFGLIPRRNVPVRQLPQEPVQPQERRQVVKRPVPLDALFMAFHMCSREHPDYYAFDILSDILSNGRSSRLNRRLVQEQKMLIFRERVMRDCCILVENRQPECHWNRLRPLYVKSCRSCSKWRWKNRNWRK